MTDSVHITNREIYDELQTLKAQVSAISARLQDLDAIERRGDAIHADFERRLRTVERVVWSAGALGTILGAAITAAVTAVVLRSVG